MSLCGRPDRSVCKEVFAQGSNGTNQLQPQGMGLFEIHRASISEASQPSREGKFAELDKASVLEMLAHSLPAVMQASVCFARSVQRARPPDPIGTFFER